MVFGGAIGIQESFAVPRQFAMEKINQYIYNSINSHNKINENELIQYEILHVETNILGPWSIELWVSYNLHSASIAIACRSFLLICYGLRSISSCGSQ